MSIYKVIGQSVGDSLSPKLFRFIFKYLKINAEYDYHNISNLVAIGDISQFNVGHAIVSRALFSGFEGAVRDMASLVGR